MRLLQLIVLTLFLSLNQAWAQKDLYIKVGQANVKRSLVAMPEPMFVGNPALSPNFTRVGAEIFRVIQNDLSASGYFLFIDSKSYLENPARTSAKPFPGDPNGFKFESWKTIGTEFLIRLNFNIAANKVSLDAFVYSISTTKLILANKYSASSDSVRRIAHKFSNDLMEALTGKEGMFLSKLVFSSDRAGGRSKEVYVMDWDGFGLQRITTHNSITLSPTWSPDGKKIAYTAFVNKGSRKIVNADLLLYNLETGKRVLMSYRRGINSGATFHPNGNSLFLTLSEEGTSDIYKSDLEGKILGKITQGPNQALNVEPNISPDGNKIAFSSDRAGNPMIWVMNLDGSNMKRLTYAGKYNSTPVWSPDGNKLVFMSYQDGAFDLYVINSDGSNLQRLTDARMSSGKRASNENPSFSPDGRHVVFNSNRTGKWQIYMINIDGTNERRITFDNYNYYQPKWSKNF